MFFLRKVHLLLLISTIGVAFTSTAFAQTLPTLSAGGRTIGGPAVSKESAATVIWRSTPGINICVSAVPSTTTSYTLSLAPGGGIRNQTGPTSMCAAAQTSVTLTTNGQPVSWRVDLGLPSP
jgi:hypothetical protein